MTIKVETKDGVYFIELSETDTHFISRASNTPAARIKKQNSNMNTLKDFADWVCNNINSFPNKKATIV